MFRVPSPELLQYSEAAVRITPSQAAPKHLANVLRKNDLRALAGLASCGWRRSLAGDFAVTRGRQETVNFARTRLQGTTGDLPARIDGADCLQQKQRRISRNQGVEVRHHPVLPEEGTAVPVYIERPAYHLAFAVNADGCARNVPGKRAEGRSSHHSARGRRERLYRRADSNDRLFDLGY